MHNFNCKAALPYSASDPEPGVVSLQDCRTSSSSEMSQEYPDSPGQQEPHRVPKHPDETSSHPGQTPQRDPTHHPALLMPFSGVTMRACPDCGPNASRTSPATAKPAAVPGPPPPPRPRQPLSCISRGVPVGRSWGRFRSLWGISPGLKLSPKTRLADVAYYSPPPHSPCRRHAEPPHSKSVSKTFGPIFL